MALDSASKSGYSGRVRHPGILNDILFKIVFGTQAGEPILRALVNALLDLEGEHKIVALTLLNPISEKEFIDDKGPILDLKARDQMGRQYNVEVQLSPGLGDYIPRSLYYVSKFFSDQIQRGDSYHQLLKTVSISLLDFDLLPDPERVHSRFLLREKEDGSVLTELLELHYIELRKFRPTSPSNFRPASNAGSTFSSLPTSMPGSIRNYPKVWFRRTESLWHLTRCGVPTPMTPSESSSKLERRPTRTNSIDSTPLTARA